ncbi:MAG TPA: cysteine desulfurase [Flavobacterium sp.]|nr:cysteine desulfurase [Flavobacterium sp.]
MDTSTNNHITTAELAKPFGLDINKIRKDFPMLDHTTNGKKLIYFDSAATNHKPKQVIEKINTLYTKEYGKPQEEHELSKTMQAELENSRNKIAAFLQATESKQIIFTSGCTEGINIVAQGFGKAILKKGDEIMITALEHHANISPWHIACEMSGAKLVIIPVDNDGIPDLKEFDKLISKKTRIISIAHTSHVLGTVLPVAEIIKVAHMHDIPVLVDAAQSAPHMPINVHQMDCDFLTFSAHKMGGPAGVGVLYGKIDWLNKIPPHNAGTENTKTVTYEKTTYESLPRKFEAGTTAFEEIVALGELVDYVTDLDMEKTSEYEKSLLRYLTQKLSEVPRVRLYGLAAEKEPVLSFAVDGVDIKTLEKYLSDEHNISVRAGELSAQPLMKMLNVPGLLRASLCYYNTVEEIDSFVDAVKSFIHIIEKVQEKVDMGGTFTENN